MSWSVVAVIFLLSACFADVEPCVEVLVVPKVAESIVIDGVLSERCYSTCQPLTAFVNAADTLAKVPSTRAWVFWSKSQFVVAFECDDSKIVAVLPDANERAVDDQDRVEWFLWSGRESDPYYCFEMAPLGAVHDYKARFYRIFDSEWVPKGFTCKARVTATGYCVEAAITREGLKDLGFTLERKQVWRSGLFRAEFNRLGGEPTWITWIDTKTKEPDFHVAGAFGSFRLD